MAEYETITWTFRDVRMLDQSWIGDNRYNFVLQEQRRIEPPKPVEETVLADACIRFSANDFFIYRNSEGQEWACPMSKRRRTFIEAILAAENGCLAENVAFKLLGLPHWETKKMHNFVGGIKRKLQDYGVPVKLISENCQFRFV